MPRVSLPDAPASERKQGVSAVRRSGSSSSAVICSRDQVGQRHLGGGDQPAAVGGVEQVLGELRQLAGAEHRLVAHQQRRRDLGVAVLLGLDVEHELAERPLQPRQLALAAPRTARRTCARRPRSPSCRAPAPRSTWSFGVRRSNGSPQRRTSTLPCSSAPGGHVGGRAGWAGRPAASLQLGRAMSASVVDAVGDRRAFSASTSAISALRRGLVLRRLGLADQLGGLVAAALGACSAVWAARSCSSSARMRRRLRRQAPRGPGRGRRPRDRREWPGCRAWGRRRSDGRSAPLKARRRARQGHGVSGGAQRGRRGVVLAPGAARSAARTRSRPSRAGRSAGRARSC